MTNLTSPPWDWIGRSSRNVPSKFGGLGNQPVEFSHQHHVGGLGNVDVPEEYCAHEPQFRRDQSRSLGEPRLLAGGSLAGNDSCDASSTTSKGAPAVTGSSGRGFIPTNRTVESIVA